MHIYTAVHNLTTRNLREGIQRLRAVQESQLKEEQTRFRLFCAGGRGNLEVNRSQDGHEHVMAKITLGVSRACAVCRGDIRNRENVSCNDICSVHTHR